MASQQVAGFCTPSVFPSSKELFHFEAMPAAISREPRASGWTDTLMTVVRAAAASIGAPISSVVKANLAADWDPEAEDTTHLGIVLNVVVRGMDARLRSRFWDALIDSVDEKLPATGLSVAVHAVG